MKPDYTSPDGRIKLYNADCMDYMATLEPNAFELAVVDPPYGIGGGSNVQKMNVSWDSSIPTKKYFIDLCSTSKNQIIWGGNYMSLSVPFFSKHTIVWDKENGGSFMSDGEIAFTSFDKQTTRFFRLFWMSNMMKPREKPLIHPTQKPMALYEWIYKNYSKEGDRILDTHLGSGSSAIAAHHAGLEFVGIELDEDYFKAAVERFEKETAQSDMFGKDAS